jgi:hypothetical protein
MPQIDASYDMAWQQRSSGHVYNSVSGHGTLFGRRTRKIIGLVIKSKLCYFCSTFTRKYPDLEVPLHECWKSHEDSSASMESSGAVKVFLLMPSKRRRLLFGDFAVMMTHQSVWTASGAMPTTSRTTTQPKSP